MSEIAPRAGIPKRTITPDTSAPSAPTITAPGTPVVTDPVSSGTRRREAEMRKKYEDIERRYGRDPDVGYRARRGEFRPKPAPATPVSDAYIITIRGKKEEPPGVSLDTLVIQQEQRKREDWIRDETVRAHVLPSQLQHEIAVASYHRQLDAYNKQLQEYNKALDERRKLDEEAKKYGHDTYEELLAAVQEEKAIKRANELGKALTEAQLIAQTVAREGYTGATAYYGRDPGELIEEQRQIGAAAQASLAQNFGIEIGPEPQEYFQTAAAVPVTVKEREVARTHLQGVIDPINKAIEAGTPASELPLLPAGITAMARKAGVDSGFDAWAFQYTETVTRAKTEKDPVHQTYDRYAEDAPQRVGAVTDLLPTTSRLAFSFLGDMVGAGVDIFSGPARTIVPDIPLAREEFAAHPEKMIEGAIIGGGIILGVAGGAALLGGAGAAGGGGAIAASGSSIATTGGGAATGLAARTAAPGVIEEGLKATAAAGALTLGAEMVRRTIEFPSGLPDWAEIHKDPHGGVGSEGSEIPLPDWMSGDPEVIIDPGVDWRAPGESFDEYLRYRRSLPGEGPPARGPVPYYPGSELTVGGRTIHAPEITPSPDYFNSPERLIGRTMFDPEIKPDTVRKRFAPELPTPPSSELFPTELHRGAGSDTDPILSREQVPIHPLGDPISPVWHTPDYTDSLMVVSAGVTLPGTIRRGIVHRREPTLPFDGGIHESLRVRPFKTPSKRRKAQKEEEIGYDYTFTPIPPEVPQVTVPGIITPRPDSGITTKFTPIHTAGIEAKARPGVITLSPVKPLHIATPDATAVSGVDVGAGVAAGTLAASVTGTLSGVASVSATRPAVATLPRLARPNISRIEYQPETVNVQPVVNITITTPIFARERTRRDDRRRRRDEWEEFYLNYAERPNPLASLEEAYTNLPGPKIRPAKVITNLQRITIGTPPKIQPIRAPKTRTGKPLRRARQNVPWDVPSIGLDSLTTLTKPKRKKSKRRRR